MRRTVKFLCGCIVNKYVHRLLSKISQTYPNYITFRHACKTGNYCVIKRQVYSGLWLDIEPVGESSGLIEACKHGNPTIVNFLIRHGANLELHGIDGTHAILELCIGKHTSALKKILTYPKVRDLICDLEYTVLYNLESIHSTKLITEMINVLNPSNALYGLLLLHYTAYNNTKISLLLIQLGFHINVKSQTGKTPLLNAISYGNIHIVAELINHAVDVNLTGEYAPLLAACWNNHQDIVLLLMRNGASLTHESDNGKTILHLLSESGKLKYLKLVYNKSKCDINHQDYYGMTPLHYAVYNNLINCARWILSQQYTDVNILTRGGNSVLMYAIKHDNIEMIQLLLENDADELVLDAAGRSMLVIYLNNQMYSLDTLKMLLSYRPNMRDVDTTGLNILELAIRYRNISAISEISLHIHFSCIESALFECIETKYTDAICVLSSMLSNK